MFLYDRIIVKNTNRSEIMDKVTFIAYELYHSSSNNRIRTIAIELLRGGTSLREISKDKHIKVYLDTALEKYKQLDSFINSHEYSMIMSFVEEHLYTSSM